jgi:ABC-2 type transport system permease protein
VTDHPAPQGGLVFDRTPFDPARAEGLGLADTRRSLRTALQLGWKVESNWTDPVLFVIYTVAKPIASLLLLVVMIQIIGAGGTGQSDETVMTFVVLGSALWATIVAGIAGPAWSVLEDRERYRMLKYLYVAPSTFLVLLIGRGSARLIAGAAGTVVALVFAAIFLGVRIDITAIAWPLFVTSLVLGIVPILGIGVLLAAVCLQTRQESWSYPEAFAGAMFLVSGVVFPLAILPDPLEWLGLVNPITWWVEGMRQALLPGSPTAIGGPGSVWTAVTGTNAPDGATIVLALFVTGALATLAAIAIFRRSEHRARDLGLLDRTTGS